jgi:hypothetical protein
MQQCIKILFLIYMKLNMFRPHTAHPQLHIESGAVVTGRCQAEADSVQQLHVQQPSTYKKPEAASTVLGS